MIYKKFTLSAIFGSASLPLWKMKFTLGQEPLFYTIVSL